ncbi:Putative membrane protein OS=Castellaniella defragrans OX=75697 GN=HNR28_000206 PE=4 SV=1 [Castellaniella defragrans]
MRFFKRYFITGLLIWLPLIATVWVLMALANTLGSLVPSFLSPEALFGRPIPGFELVLVLVIILLTGLLFANVIGRALLSRWEALLGRIPLVRSIYNSVKQVSDTLFAPNGQAFREAVLVQYPRKGSWTIAFLTGAPSGEVADLLEGDFISVYVPTTPNPTSGFFLMMPRADVQVLDMSVEAALKYIVSMGVAAPASLPRRRAPSPVAEPESPESP